MWVVVGCYLPELALTVIDIVLVLLDDEVELELLLAVFVFVFVFVSADAGCMDPCIIDPATAKIAATTNAAKIAVLNVFITIFM